MNRIQLTDIEDYLFDCEVIINKADRIVDGVNHGRTVHKGDGVYYKIFDKEYCRRENFVRALEVGFFDEIAPALQSLIVDGNDIVGYVTEAGDTSNSSIRDMSEFFYKDKSIQALQQKLLKLANEKKLFYYDLVPQNTVVLKSGKISLIDLESVYPLNELYLIHRHSAVVKPNFYGEDLVKIFDEYYYYD